MSGRRSRTGAALLSGMTQTREINDQVGDTEIERPMAGNWSREALKENQRLREEAEEEARLANARQFEGIVEGAIPIRIPVEQIVDDVGTDRVIDNSFEDESFSALVENIRTRGLRQPIRVRNTDHTWRPDDRYPRDVTGQVFALQSGRRRLAACRELGIEPLCFLSFADEADAKIDDLHERFFENTTRKDLTTYEVLYSIGMIVNETPDATPAQMAEILGVSRAQISRGTAVYTHDEELRKVLDPKTCTRREISEALTPMLKAPASTDPDAVRKRAQRAKKAPSRAKAPALPFSRRKIGLGTVRLAQKNAKTRVLTIESTKLDDETLEQVLDLIERVKD